jgi:hypothetical protein
VQKYCKSFSKRSIQKAKGQCKRNYVSIKHHLKRSVFMLKFWPRWNQATHKLSNRTPRRWSQNAPLDGYRGSPRLGIQLQTKGLPGISKTVPLSDFSSCIQTLWYVISPHQSFWVQGVMWQKIKEWIVLFVWHELHVPIIPFPNIGIKKHKVYFPRHVSWYELDILILSL